MIFHSGEQLRLHAREHTSGEVYKCIECSLLKKSPKDLELHIESCGKPHKQNVMGVSTHAVKDSSVEEMQQDNYLLVTPNDTANFGLELEANHSLLSTNIHVMNSEQYYYGVERIDPMDYSTADWPGSIACGYEHDTSLNSNLSATPGLSFDSRVPNPFPSGYRSDIGRMAQKEAQPDIQIDNITNGNISKSSPERISIRINRLLQVQSCHGTQHTEIAHQAVGKTLNQ